MGRLVERRRRRRVEAKVHVIIWPSPQTLIAQSAQRLRASLDLLRETDPLVDPGVPAWPRRRSAGLATAEAGAPSAGGPGAI